MGQLPIQEMVMMRKCTPTELVDIAAVFQQKARKSMQASLARLWDTCGGVGWGAGDGVVTAFL